MSVSEKNINPKNFVDEWNLAVNMLKDKYSASALNSVIFVPIEGENGNANKDAYRYANSRETFKNEWNMVCSKLKNNKKALSIPLILTNDAEVR